VLIYSGDWQAFAWLRCFPRAPRLCDFMIRMHSLHRWRHHRDLHGYNSKGSVGSAVIVDRGDPIELVEVHRQITSRTASVFGVDLEIAIVPT